MDTCYSGRFCDLLHMNGEQWDKLKNCFQTNGLELSLTVLAACQADQTSIDLGAGKGGDYTDHLFGFGGPNVGTGHI